MVSHYLLLLRTLWLGGLWMAIYLVRPLLSGLGFFPQHGVLIIHWVMGSGAGLGFALLSLGWYKDKAILRKRPKAMMTVVMMTLLSLCYFAFMPWWKLQMIICHGVSLLGLIWFFQAPRTVF